MKRKIYDLLLLWQNKRENKDDRMEIDFLIAKSTITSRHNISPIEVKTSTGFTTTSLKKCLKKYAFEN